MIKVSIYTDKGRGFIEYDSETGKIMITHPESTTREKIRKYLTTERRFSIPKEYGDDTTPSRQIITQTPSDNESILMLSLNEMHSRIGVHVDWGHKENRYQ